MELKHIPYHVTRNRITFILSVLWLIIWVIVFHFGYCDLKWFLLMIMIIGFAYSFRRALRRLE